VNRLLAASPSALPSHKPEVLWSLKYRAMGRPIDSQAGSIHSSPSGRVLVFPPGSIDLVFDDSILDCVREMWTRVVAAGGDGVVDARDFCRFDDGDGVTAHEGEDVV
jgi:hypothetical protein